MTQPVVVQQRPARTFPAFSIGLVLWLLAVGLFILAILAAGGILTRPDWYILVASGLASLTLSLRVP